jgi:hypothetical protein
MQQFEQVFSHSIKQYEVILSFLQKMEKEIGTASPDELLELSKSLADLQSQAAETDQMLLPQLREHSALNEKMAPLIDERELLMKEILLLNARISEKASGVKSLIAHEMEKLRNGISALGGYMQQQNTHGRIVDRIS